MKLKVLVFAVAVAAVAASAASAAPPAGKGKPPATGAGCKPMVSVILKGTLATDAGPAPTSLSVNATAGNHFAKAWKKHAASVALTSETKVNRAGDTNPADLKSGDKVNIRATSCKADLANNATPALTAFRVTAYATATA